MSISRSVGVRECQYRALQGLENVSIALCGGEKENVSIEFCRGKRMSVSRSVRERKRISCCFRGKGECQYIALFQARKQMPASCSIQERKKTSTTLSLCVVSCSVQVRERISVSCSVQGEKRTSVSVVLCSGDKQKFSLVFYLRKTVQFRALLGEGNCSIKPITLSSL